MRFRVRVRVRVRVKVRVGVSHDVRVGVRVRFNPNRECHRDGVPPLELRRVLVQPLEECSLAPLHDNAAARRCEAGTQEAHDALVLQVGVHAQLALHRGELR